jgi:stage II sporulation protein D
MLAGRFRGVPTRGLVALGAAGSLVVGTLLLAPGASSATAPALTLAVAQKLTPPANVTFSGAGWGHGVGLSQYGALGMAREGFTASQIVRHYYTGTTVSPVLDNVDIKVNLQYHASTTAFRSEAVVAGGGKIQVQLNGRAAVLAGPTDVFTVGRNAAGLTLTQTSSTGVKTLLGTSDGITVRWGGTSAPGAAGALATVLDVNSSVASLTSTGHRYRYGFLTFVPTKGSTATFEVVNTLRIHDEYLLGIAEVPSSWPQAALQAQIIAARSYALSKVGNLRDSCRCNVDDGSGPYYDQTFVGYAEETGSGGSNWQAAVKTTNATATTGQAVLYAGQPISAFYTSATGGRTQSSKDVWGGTLPWAVSVDDHWSLDPTVTGWAVWNPRTRTQANLASVFGLPNVVSLDLSNRLVSNALATATATSSTGRKVTIGGYTFARGMGLPSLWMWRAQQVVSGNSLTAAADAAPQGTTAVLASADGASTVDSAIAASYASAKSLPYLLTPSAGLSATTVAALTSRKVTTVYAIGSYAELPAALLAQVQKLQIKVIRITGSNPTALSLAVATKLNAAAGTPALVVSVTRPGAVVAAAASAGILRRPLIVLLSGTAAPPSVVSRFVAALRPASTLVVGPAGWLSDSIGSSFPGARRVGGATEADVSAQLVADAIPPGARATIGIASLTGPSGSALAVAATGSPVLWIGATLSPSALALLQTMSTTTIRAITGISSAAAWQARRA